MIIWFHRDLKLVNIKTEKYFLISQKKMSLIIILG